MERIGNSQVKWQVVQAVCKKIHHSTIVQGSWCFRFDDAGMASKLQRVLNEYLTNATATSQLADHSGFNAKGNLGNKGRSQPTSQEPSGSQPVMHKWIMGVQDAIASHESCPTHAWMSDREIGKMMCQASLDPNFKGTGTSRLTMNACNRILTDCKTDCTRSLSPPSVALEFVTLEFMKFPQLRLAPVNWA
jgi:hypothetical protein